MSSGSGLGRLIIFAAVAAWYAASGPVPSARGMGCQPEEHLAIPLKFVVGDPGEGSPFAVMIPDLGHAPCSSRLPAPPPAARITPSADLIAAAIGRAGRTLSFLQPFAAEPSLRPHRESHPPERPPR